MKEINIAFEKEQDVINFVHECEKDFEIRLDIASKEIVNSGATNILLSGPTCAGKTTTAEKIINDYKEKGKKVTVISIDDFFLDRTEQREVCHDKKIDYDSIDVLDLPLLAKCINDAKVGNTIKVPKFNFITQSRSSYTEHTIEENEVLIFEGIQAVYPEITSLFKGDCKGIFIDVLDDVCVNGVTFKKHEIRLIRRLVRDRKFRGASPDFTFYLWESVRDNEKKSIYPNKDICSVQIDSFMGYELFLMKKYLTEVLSEVDKNGKYFEKACKLLAKIEAFQEIDFKYIPENSLYTEFLGKK
jgi:uridine kinase